MSRQRSVLGALVLGVLCFAAFSATSASAAVSSLHECVKLEGTTSKGRFEDAECKNSSKTGEFMTVRILEEPIKLTATQTSPFVLKAAPLGIQTEITCNEMMSAETTAKNTEAGFQGEGKTTFSSCTVNKPAGCTVLQPIETVKLKASSEDLAGEVMRTKYTPASGSAFVTITLENCGLLNGGHTVTGVARSQQTSVESEEFSPTSGSELEFFGAPAELSGSLHFVTQEDPTKKVYRETP